MSHVHVAGETTVRFLGGGVLITHGRDGVLFEAPPGISETLVAGGLLSRVHGVALSGGRMRAIGGLLPLLGALEPHRTDVPLPLWFPLHEERVGSVADLWTRGWPGRYDLLVDGLLPGDPFETAIGEVETIPLRRGEARWRPEPRIEGTIGVGWRIRTPDLRVAIGLGTGPTTALRRLCRDVDLAILEVGQAPWPSSSTPWRLTLTDAVTAGDGARVLWLVGDDGRITGDQLPS